MLVAMGSAPLYDAVLDEIVALDVSLLRMEQRRHSLEDLFRDEEPVAPA